MSATTTPRKTRAGGPLHPNPTTPKNKTSSFVPSKAASDMERTDGHEDALKQEDDAEEDDGAETDGHGPSADLDQLAAKNTADAAHWTGEAGSTGMFDLNDASFSSDEDSDGDPEPEFEINDDDDYNAVDNISETSEQSEAFEADVEREIFAAGENNIDWDDENTYAFNDSWDNHQYSLLTGFDEPATPIERELFSRARRQSSVRPANDTSHLSTFLKGTPLDEDWSSSSSSSASDAGGDESKENQNPNDASAEEAASSTDDETDDDAIVTETVHTPSVTLNRPTSRLVNRTPSVRSSIEGQPTSTRAPGKFGVMRKFKINPRKAVAFSTPDVGARGGRTIHFNAPRQSNLRWISAHTSRSSSMSSNQATMLDFGDSRTGSIITDVINGRLFQQFNCTTPDRHSNTRGPTDFARIAMARNAYPRLAGGVFADLDESAIDDETHDRAMSLVDFQDDDDEDQDNVDEREEDGGSNINLAVDKTPMLPPARPLALDDTVRAPAAFGNRLQAAATAAAASHGAQEMPPSSPLAHVSRNAGKTGPELGAAFEPRPKQPGTPDSEEFPSSRPTTSGQSSSPRKRRNTGEFDEPSSLTPVMKKQRM